MIANRWLWSGSAVFAVVTALLVVISNDGLQMLRMCLGVGISILGLAGYVPYYISIAKGLTKPHPVSWVVWAVVDGIAFFGQLSVHAGPSIWLTGSTAFMCALTGVIGVSTARRGVLKVDRGDWASLIGALAALTLMLILPNPLAAMILGQMVTLIGYVPTVRKVKADPTSEDIGIYWIADAKYVLAIPALSTFNVTSLLWPVVATLNSVFMTWLIWSESRKVRVSLVADPVAKPTAA